MADTRERQQEIEKLRRDLRRRSLDQIRVYNPLEIPFTTIYDGFTYVVRQASEGIFLRYIAEKWMREFCDYMINAEEKEQVDAENDKRKKKGWQIMTPQERDEFDVRNKLLTSDNEKRIRYMKMIYKGVSQEHGLDIPEGVPVKTDRRPQDEKILDQLDKEMGIRDMLPEDNFDVEDKKEELLKEVGDE